MVSAGGATLAAPRRHVMASLEGEPEERMAERIDQVRTRIAVAGGDRAITLVAVTKGFGPQTVATALSAGLVDIGENYAQELVAKAAALPAGGESPRWHFLGPLQTNKA